MHFSQCKNTIAIAFRSFRKTKTMYVTVSTSPWIFWDCFSRVSEQLLLLKARSPNIFICMFSNIGMSQRMYMCVCVCIGVYILARITLELQISHNIYTKHKYILLFSFSFFCVCWFRVSNKKNYLYIVKCANFYVFFVIRKSTFFRFLYTI